MNTKRFCELTHVTPGTFRNWTITFAPFLSPLANPAKGKKRILSDHDLRVLYFVSTLRDTGLGLSDISDRLKDLQRNDWVGLTDLPVEWADPGESVSVGVAVSKAYDVAQIAVLQRDLEYTRIELETAKSVLQAAQERVAALESEIGALQTAQVTAQSDLQQQLYAAQLEAEKHRGEVAALQAKLSAYAITGGDRPIPVALIIAVSALAALMAVLVVLIVVRLVL